MKPKIVNPYLIAAILEPFLFLEPSDADCIAEISPSDETKIRACIRNLLVPYFQGFDQKSKSEIKDSLAYMLLQGSDKWEMIIEMNQSPLKMTTPPSKFFEWLWDEMFHEQVGLTEDVRNYSIKEDIHAPNLIRRG